MCIENEASNFLERKKNQLVEHFFDRFQFDVRRVNEGKIRNGPISWWSGMLNE